MARLITLSRAARLVGVKRSTLQARIRAGELNTFEGQLDLTELLRVYPQTKVDDSAMLERADQLIERALSRVVRDQEGLPDAEVLATRVTALSHELGTANFRMRRYELAMQQLQSYLRKLADEPERAASAVGELRDWLDETLQKLTSTVDAEGDLYATDMLLRVMAAQVHLEPSGHEFFVQGNDNLLDSGLRAGLALDYGCRDGSCGRCLAKLKSGLVKLVRKPRYRLNSDERAAGLTLLCCNTAVTDLLFDVQEVDSAVLIEPQRLRMRVGTIERVDPDLVLLSLRPIDGERLRFFAGQSVRLSSDGDSGQYPIASCPCDEHQLEFHIRPRSDDAFSQRLVADIGPNHAVEVAGPQGDFMLDQNSLHPVIFIAWDTGFAPIKSLIEHAMALDNAESLHLFWVHTRGESPYLHNRCRAWSDALENFFYRPVRASADLYRDDEGAHALLSTLLAAAAEPHFDVAAFDFYLAGPAPMLAQAQRYFTARGVPAAQLHLSPLDP